MAACKHIWNAHGQCQRCKKTREAVFIDVALRWWNVQRGYRADGSRETDDISEDVVDQYEAELRLKMCQWLSEEWRRRGNALHPGDETSVIT